MPAATKAEAVYRTVYGEIGAHCPARIIVSAGELHFGCLVEIEAVAECTQKGEAL